MWKNLIGILFLTSSFPIFSQNDSISDTVFQVYYKTQVNAPESPLSEEIQLSLQKIGYSGNIRNDLEAITYSLFVDEGKSLYHMNYITNYPYEKIVGAHTARINMYYVDSTQIKHKTEINKNTFIVYDSLKKNNWIFKEGTKEILGFSCKKAELVGKDYDGTEITAWYTEAIPTPFGPKGHNGLPGLILEIIQNKKLHYKAFKIDWNASSIKNKFVEDGSIITRKEYNEIIEKQMSYFKKFFDH